MRTTTPRRLLFLSLLALVLPLVACPGGGSTDEGGETAEAHAGN